MEHQKVKTLGSQVLDRRGKLLRWAELVKGTPRVLALFDMLENKTQSWRKSTVAQTALGDFATAMTVATRDPVLNAAGLAPNASIQGLMDFFEILPADLHAFSCNCGGEIDNQSQAEGIARLAG